MASKTRGSEQLMKGRAISPAQMDRFITLARGRGVKVVDWHILGQPTPEAVTGTFQVGTAQAAKLVQQSLSLKGIRPRIEIFPHGIPNPNVFNVRVRF